MPSEAFRTRSRSTPGAWLLCCLSTMALVGVLLVSCGSSEIQPSGYLFTDTSRLSYLTWNQSSDGRLRGQWTQVRYDPSALSATARPQISSLGYTGQVQHQQVTLTLAPGTTLTGQVQDQTLRLNAADGSGLPVAQVWVSVSSQDESALLGAFTAYEHLRGALATLKSDVRIGPLDIATSTLQQQVNSATDYVAMLRARLTGMQQDLSEAGRCTRARDFAQVYPAPQSEFNLYGPAGDTFLSDLSTAQDSWKAAKRFVLPHPNGLHLPWLVSDQAFTTAIAPAEQAISAFGRDHQDDLDRMSALKDQYQHIGAQVDAIKKSC